MSSFFVTGCCSLESNPGATHTRDGHVKNKNNNNKTKEKNPSTCHWPSEQELEQLAPERAVRGAVLRLVGGLRRLLSPRVVVA